MYVTLLISGDVEWHSTEDNFRPHAFYSSSYSQVQLATERELRSGAQVRQRLQRLSKTQHKDLGLRLDVLLTLRSTVFHSSTLVMMA